MNGNLTHFHFDLAAPKKDTALYEVAFSGTYRIRVTKHGTWKVEGVEQAHESHLIEGTLP